MSLTPDSVRKELARVKYPGFSRDIVSFGMVQGVDIDGRDVTVRLAVTTQDREIPERIRREAEEVVRGMQGVGAVQVTVIASAPPRPGPPPAGAMDPFAGRAPIPGVRNVLAVASGKGGVGKSTVAVNLACALSRLGHPTGLLDCDIYGPSVPTMMGVHVRPAIEGDKLVPVVNHGVKLMSLGFLLEEDMPVIWRGPMIVKTVEQFLTDVHWAPLDYLVVDLPPGTGDAQLTLTQKIPVEGAIIVTTPQDVALIDAKKGVAMFARVEVPVLGIVENMSYFRCPDCGTRHEIFGHGGGRREALRLQVPFLGEIPIYSEIRRGGDAGLPIVVEAPESEPGQAFLALAGAVAGLQSAPLRT